MYERRVLSGDTQGESGSGQKCDRRLQVETTTPTAVVVIVALDPMDLLVMKSLSVKLFQEVYRSLSTNRVQCIWQYNANTRAGEVEGGECNADAEPFSTIIP